MGETLSGDAIPLPELRFMNGKLQGKWVTGKNAVEWRDVPSFPVDTQIDDYGVLTPAAVLGNLRKLRAHDHLLRGDQRAVVQDAMNLIIQQENMLFQQGHALRAHEKMYAGLPAEIRALLDRIVKAVGEFARTVPFTDSEARQIAGYLAGSSRPWLDGTIRNMVYNFEQLAERDGQKAMISLSEVVYSLRRALGLKDGERP